MKLRPLAVCLSLTGAIIGNRAGSLHAAAALPASTSPYAQWKHGPPADDQFFPIAVWLQNPRNAGRFKAAGINTYVGLWRGPTKDQLVALENAGMQLICAQNPVALENRESSVIVGWMHGDEPDNAQSLHDGKGYGPPILPEKIIRDYEEVRAADPTRPVLLNLGQGVAWDNYIGRGVRRNHPEDYAQYIKGCDIASFDIYPAVHDAPEIAGKLEFVAHGVERLLDWSKGDKIVWNCIECTHISNPATKATPDQIRSEVWMALIQGSRGLIYFVHQFKPTFNEAALLDDAELLPAVTAINQQIRELAPVLNRPSVSGIVKVSAVPLPSNAVNTSDHMAPNPAIASMTKRLNGKLYLFTANLRNQAVSGSFQLTEATAKTEVVVLGEHRSIGMTESAFTDEFKPYGVHLYSIASAP